MTAFAKRRQTVQPNEWLREAYLDYMTGRAVPRPMFVELFGPLVGLPEEWRAQGASEDEIALTAFGFDHVRRHRVRVNAGGMVDALPARVIEETDAYVLQTNRFGLRQKLCKAAATIPLPLEYPVRTFDDWEKLKPKYQFREDRFGEGWREEARRAREAGALIVVGIPGGFDEPRQLLGEEGLCLAYYEQPELVHDILQTIGATAERVLDVVSREVGVDQLSVHEDMAGKSGPLAGPVQVRAFIRPYYRRIWDLLAAREATLFSQDSDGNMNPVIDAFREAGVNCMFPMEPAAGMDIVATRRAYGARLAMLGGVDKHVLRQGEDAIRRELDDKLAPELQQGGVVFGLDHRIPNGTPLAAYRFYVRTARERLGLPPAPDPSWARMAF